MDSRDNAIDLCATSENPSAKTVVLPWYRGVPYTVSMSPAQGPVYFDSSHLGTFQGVHVDGIIGSTEADRAWMVENVEPGSQLAIPPSYKNIENFTYLPDCGNISDNSGAFNLDVAPSGWGSWPPVPSAPVGTAAIITPNGIVYTFGGGCNDTEYSNTVYWLDPRTDDG
ncbi:MAG: hypothetical protein KC729_13845, partial [Candidatus Eisenbacteria bacterium]|nr:hypothetical protein [Candidatus Eisenbacteria bacterium]